MKNLNWKVLLFLFMLPCFGYAQQAITGMVTESDGVSPIPGVNIVIKGTTSGTISGMDGSYSINVNEGETLVFSFVGFVSKEVLVGQESTINVSLETDAIGLEEVIAVGYSSKKKTEISSAVVNVSSEKLQTSTSHDVATMLQGKVAGLQVMSDQQSVGGSPQMRIRGSGSISASSSPLWVVDGIIGGSFDPQDVADITVLKDAGATGLYGSRAAGGVIVVTTKRGKAGDTKVRISSTTGIVKPNWGNLEFMDGPEFYDLIRRGFALGGKTESEFLALFPSEVRNVNYDWMGFMYDQGFVTTNNISLSGGNEKTTFYLSGNYNHEDGILRSDVYDRGSATLNLSHKLSDKLSIQLNTFSSFVKNQNTTSFTVFNVPFDTPYDEDGNVRPQDWVRNNYYTQERINFALPEELGSYNERGTLTLNPSLKLDYNPTEWMSVSASTRINYMSSVLERYDADGAQSTDIGGEVRNNLTRNSDILTNAILRLYKSYGEHALSGIIGGEFNEITHKYFEAHGAGYSGESTILDVAAVPQSVSGNNRTTTYNSFFSQVDYNYQSKYFFTGSYRVDGSSRFGANNRYGQFWSVAGSWMLSNEDFINDLGLFNSLKLRSSYGLTGNASLDDYVHLNTFTLDASYMGENALSALSIGNPDLTWEVARTFNLGVDASVLDNRISMTLDYYYSKNSDLLFRVPLPAEFGYSEQWRNIGRLDNWGYELALDIAAVKTPDFNWNVNLQIGYSQDEVKELPGEAIDADEDGLLDNSIVYLGSDLFSNKILQVGGNRSMFYAAEWYGADPQTGGARWVSGYNNDGSPVLTDNREEALWLTAKGMPDFMGGFTNVFEYKGLSLETVFSYAFGDFTIIRDNAYDNDGQYLFRPEMVVYGQEDRWEKPGDVSSRTPWVYQGDLRSSQYSSKYWENGNYLKLASLSLGYSFNKNVTQRLGLGALKVFARGENLKVWHKSSGISPELTGFDADAPTRNSRPLPSKVVFGIDLTL
ncbi:SusC/RagA family TonB-linked outer membrane protein [Draconibacterium sediminis]|nr:SusC/RagA family TonB-linked outer membrane protein [Draconibacterium sediminis]